MEIKEKLEVFHEAVLQTASAESEALLEEYKKNYQESLEEYEKKKQQEQETGERIAEAKIRKEVNKQISEHALELKRTYHLEAEKKKAILFERVEEKLKEYQRTEAYKEYLERAVSRAKKFAKEEKITIYLNESDARWRDELEQKTGCKLMISQIDFIGGIRAVIRSKNILIDESFSTRLAQEKEKYSF